MKLKSVLVLVISPIILMSFRSDKMLNEIHKNKKIIHLLKDKKGDLLGKVYIEDFTKDIFRKLLITKERKGKTDTLYFINECLFKNPKGTDIKFDKETFNGYKIELLNNDNIQLFGVGKGSVGASDPVTIVWNYKRKIFEVEKTP